MMRAFELAELAAALPGQLHGPNIAVGGAAIDSRRVQAGDLFVALPGGRADGHDFVDAARAAGAAAALVSRRVAVDIPQLLVGDVQHALGAFGALNRSAYRQPLVAITGSCGKTTVRAMLAAVLRQRGPTLATDGNYNNELGVPLTLLRLEPGHAFAVIEMGARGRGHIDYLCSLGRPTVSLLLNAMAAHLDGFGTLQDVAEGKGEIFDRLPADGVGIVNADQPWAAEWSARVRASGASVVTFGLQAAADVSASAIELRGTRGSCFTLHCSLGDAAVTLAQPGLHNVSNALAVAAAATACGLSLAEIVAGLATADTVAGRLAMQRSKTGATLIDDSYNANPGSVHAAIDLLADCAAPRVLVLGVMLELGADSEAMHREVGAYASARGIDRLVGVGEPLAPAAEAFGAAGHCYASREAALAASDDWLTGAQTVLVKGSRGAGMEQLVRELAAEEALPC